MHEMLVDLGVTGYRLKLSGFRFAIPIVLAAVPLKHSARFCDLPD